ncbi:hypothetical protein ABDZ32_20705 [Aeromonas veronii]|uniref:hypothetical protein n=1 Tax=Aeromonas veronii TaxID=654 RepID=UPI0031FD200C
MSLKTKLLIFGLFMGVNYDLHSVEISRVFNTSNFVLIEDMSNDTFFVGGGVSTSPSSSLGGSSDWTRLKGSRQTTLAYTSTANEGLISSDDGVNDSYYVDMWSDTLTNNVLIGQQCFITSKGCDPNTSISQSNIYKTDSKGFYGQKAVYNNRMTARLSKNFFYILKNMGVGDTFSHTLHSCKTQRSPDSYTGKCIDLAASLRVHVESKLSHKKIAHLKLQTNDIQAKITSDTNGKIEVLPGSTGCDEYIYKGKVGVKCNFISYTYDAVNDATTLALSPVIINSLISNNVKDSDVVLVNNNGATAEVGQAFSINSLSGGSVIDLYMSSDVFKLISDKNITGQLKDFISVSFSDINNPGSGFYEVQSNTTIDILPPSPSVTISSAGGELTPYRSGVIGRDVIEFPYVISESHFSKANSLLLSVSQDNGVPKDHACTFVNGDLYVPVYAYIEFSANNSKYRVATSCDNNIINLRSYNIIESRPAFEWETITGKGSRNYYDVSLNFDLRNSVSQRSTTGELWEGEVHQSGTITVKAIWN